MVTVSTVRTFGGKKYGLLKLTPYVKAAEADAADIRRKRGAGAAVSRKLAPELYGVYQRIPTRKKK